MKENANGSEHALWMQVGEFYERLWLDAITDEGISDINRDWFDEWFMNGLRMYKPVKSIIVYESMRKFINEKSKIR